MSVVELLAVRTLYFHLIFLLVREQAWEAAIDTRPGRRRFSALRSVETCCHRNNLHLPRPISPQGFFAATLAVAGFRPYRWI